MKLFQKVINKVLYCTVLLNVCYSPVNAVSNMTVSDSRFINNMGLIEEIKRKINFHSAGFESLWAAGRKGESREHLEVDTEHILYTVQLSSTPAVDETPTVDEIFISAPIVDNSGAKNAIGTILLSAQYSRQNVQLSDIIKDFCITGTLPNELDLAEAEDVQYFLNAPDASAELPVEYQKITNLSEFEAKKDKLETTTVVIDDKDKKALGAGLSNIEKISLVNVFKAEE